VGDDPAGTCGDPFQPGLRGSRHRAPGGRGRTHARGAAARRRARRRRATRRSAGVGDDRRLPRRAWPRRAAPASRAGEGGRHTADADAVSTEHDPRRGDELDGPTDGGTRVAGGTPHPAGGARRRGGVAVPGVPPVPRRLCAR
jgi:hypothetical protein